MGLHGGQGDRLGRYEVLGPIGAGGMGEVWRARDTELGREVAVKVLPEAVASEPRRVERLRREARALAALSHLQKKEMLDGSVVAKAMQDLGIDPEKDLVPVGGERAGSGAVEKSQHTVLTKHL